MKFTTQQIQDVLENKGYHFFDKNLPFNLNIIGVRSVNDLANNFDDWLYVVYRDNLQKMITKEFSITTDPGRYWLKNPLNINGTAILVPGQYKGSHRIGLHQGKYEALKQVGNVRVWRDNDRDNALHKEGKTYEGIFGINIHRSNANGSATVVEKWSAGCQVFKDVQDFNFFIEICKKSASIYENSFTYTLLEEADFMN
ncbi:hypothetical protein [Aquimarina sp. RZ0]|uniref:hypothetical protein n=1 Tax=Aquimarina sp. RZ0 TaxID=2607730 RepID=UPI0011F3E16B|nr:hypothetical protein [Aquimarina sp. RZ0]KAA1247915.1 hypothetical protein F0000_01465 [Aquimarina sp. RZ0]